MSDFWTRRRAGVLAEDHATEAQALAEVEARAQAALADRQAAMSEAELLAHLDLPDPDGLKAGDDFAAFLRREVPGFLRQRALRRLWRTNPVLANLDGLVDHGEDFSDAATVKPAMQTAYQVGRGMVERALDRVETLIAEAEAPPPPDPVRRPTSARVAVRPAAPIEATPEIAAAAEAASLPAPRHMQFQFSEAPA
ncbi:MAG: DUF3306 domain-containing protein [Paracoccus sp. (in: a-proteobacteria)]